jgi:hypothetical protein
MSTGGAEVILDAALRANLEASLARTLEDQDVIELTTKADARIGARAFELDWRIREAPVEACFRAQAHRSDGQRHGIVRDDAAAMSRTGLDLRRRRRS